MRIKAKTGFTLIELLVVISIISLLSSVVLASLNNARAKARDSVRKSDLHQIQNALELYFSQYGGYPTSAQADGGGAAGYTIFGSIGLHANFMQYMPSIPHDPKYPNIGCYNAEYVYVSDSFRNPGTLGKYYVLYATLENQSTSNLSNSGMDAWMKTNSCPSKPEITGRVNYRAGDYN